MLLYGLTAYLARLDNLRPSKKTAGLIILLGCVPLWTAVASYSANLAFDGLLYDAIMAVTMVATLALLGAGNKFSRLNWLGCLLAICGFILMKL